MSSHRRTGIDGNSPGIIPVVYETDNLFTDTEPHTGRAVYKYANGKTYSGMMALGRPHGYGCMLTDRWVFTGSWENGKLLRGTMVHIGTGLTISLPILEVNEIN